MANQEMRLSNMVMYSTVMLQCQYKNGTTGIGTGFIMNLCRDAESNRCVPVVLTNKHVTNDSVKCVFGFCKADPAGMPIDNESFIFDLENCTWIQHPDPEVDLCCLPIGEQLNEITSRGIKVFYIPLGTNLIPAKEEINDLSAIEDVIMIGYPIGLSDTINHKPVIRKGITATHLKYDYQGKKQFLIDCACFPGSSGSPVFILNEGIVNQNGNLTIGGNRILFLGVLFAGPQFPAKGNLTYESIPVIPRPITNIPTNLGFVIKSSEILVLETYIIENILKLKLGEHL